MIKKIVACFLVVSFTMAITSVSIAENNYIVVPAQKTFVSAESRLKDFAKKAEEARMQSAMYGVGLGLLYVSMGSSFSNSSSGSNTSSMFYGLGAGMTIIGIRSYLFPTELENNYNKIRQMASSNIDERGAREAFSEKSLKQGAEEAQQGRTIASGILVGVGLLSASSGVGLLYAGLGAMSYIMKSDIEKAYDEYVADKEDFIKSQPVTLHVVVPTTTEVESKQVTSEASRELKKGN
ncbi:MAG: hypothetical protein ABIH50_02140 [bacterium]